MDVSQKTHNKMGVLFLGRTQKQWDFYLFLFFSPKICQSYGPAIAREAGACSHVDEYLSDEDEEGVIVGVQQRLLQALRSDIACGPGCMQLSTCLL